MSYKIVDSTGRKIGAVAIAKHIEEEIEAFCGASEENKALLANLAKTEQKEYIVTLQDENPTAASGNNVNINRKETKINLAQNIDQLKEAVESTIFELFNAFNSEVYKKLENDLQSGNISIFKYGVDKAKVEATASWKTATVLRERADYIPSDWGQKTIEVCGGYESSETFANFFAGQPHNSSAIKPSAAALSSCLFYTFNAAYKVGGGLDVMQYHFTKIVEKKTGRNVKLKKIKNALSGSATINTVNLKAVTYYHVMADFISTNSDLTVEWKNGGAENYRFTDELKHIAADTGGLMKIEIEKLWKTKSAEFLE